MYDYIKGYFADKQKAENIIKSNKDLSITFKYHSNTDNVIYPMRTNIDNLFLNFSEKTGYIENSIHTFFNSITKGISRNYNDFSFCDILFSLNHLENNLNIPLSEIILSTVELGFNLKLKNDVLSFLTNNLLMYKFKAPCYDPKNDKQMKIKKFIYQNYEIKVYDKARHSRIQNKNILRIEVKYKKNKELNRFGINTLEDLRNPNCLIEMFNDFLKKFEELLIIDSFDGSHEMTSKERHFFTKSTHPNFWSDTRTNKHPNTLNNKKKKFKALIQAYGLDTLRKEIKRLVYDKFYTLFDTSCMDETTRGTLVA